MPSEFDVIVIGAGPAGATAARAAAKGGLRTLLLEKHDMGRDKPCGGAVSLRTQDIVDFPIPPAVVDMECFGLRTCYGPYASEIRRAKPLAWMVSRHKFDAFLADTAARAGADLRFRQPAQHLNVDGSGVDVATPAGVYRAGAVIIADGAASQLARAVRPPFGRRQIAACLCVEIPADKATIDRLCGDCMVLEYGATRSGYIWLFPKGDHISAGIGQVCRRPVDLKGLLRGYLASKGLPADAPLQGSVLPLRAATDRIAADRVLLAGDCAGFVDPFTGEGIHYAMLSGKLAAQAMLEAFDAGDFGAEFLGRYRQACKEQFLADLQTAVHLTNALRPFRSVLLKTAVRHGEVVNRYLELFGGRRSYSRFCRWFAGRFLRLLFSRS